MIYLLAASSFAMAGAGFVFAGVCGRISARKGDDGETVFAWGLSTASMAVALGLAYAVGRLAS